jgi:WD40 repeat protein/mono/diheme cytochrome c family protein
MSVFRSLIGAAALLVFAVPVPAADTPGDKAKEPATVSYYQHIRPIFQQHCQGCHQPAKALGGYVMTTHAALLKEGDKEQPGVVPGKPEESYVIDEITPKSGKAKMPKGKPPLAASDIALITKWIAQGAQDDTPLSAREIIDPEHPPIYAAPPVLTALDYSPDGTLLAVSGHHEVLLYDAHTLALVARLVGLSERIQSVAFSPDGKRLAVTGGSPGRFGEVQIWELEKRKLKLSVQPEKIFDTVYGVSWSPDGSKVAFGCPDNTLRAVTTDTGEQVVYMSTHTDWVLNTTFSTDGEFIVSVSRDRSMRLTEVATQRFIDNVTSITPGALKGGLATVSRRPLSFQKLVKSPPDPRELLYDELLIGGSDGVPRLYKMHREIKRVIGDDANKLREFEPMPGRVACARFSADGTRFIAGSSLDGRGEVRVYAVSAALPDTRLVCLTGLPQTALPGLSPLVLMGDYRKTQTVVLEKEQGAVYAVAFRPDGNQVASGGFDGVVRLHDPVSGKLIKEFVVMPGNVQGGAK